MPRKKLTKEEFIEKSRKVHGDDFIYDKVDLENRDEKGRICIICRECGREFWQTPSNHLSGQRCPYCRYKRLGLKKCNSQEWFISESKRIFGNEYWDYTQCLYIGFTHKVFLISHEINPLTNEEYGGFWVLPNSHLKGCLPRKMALIKGKIKKKNVITTDEIINRFKKKYGNKYDYSRVKYVKMTLPVWIGYHEIDPLTGEEYGWFQQSPIHHLQGCTHPKLNGKGYTQDDMLKMFYNKHGDDFDYRESVYNGMHAKVKIICHKLDKFGKEHGEFWQTPYKHVKEGQGCPHCGGKFPKDTEQFVKELKLLYGNKLIYDNTVYVNAKTLVRVDCPKHGEQYRIPAAWLKGGGCTHCKCSIMENEMIMKLDKIGIKYTHNYDPLWLKSKKNHQQSIDFYLDDYGIAIECQGAQHFRTVEGFNKEETHIVTVERDINKRELLLKHKVPLVYYTNEHTIPDEFKIFFMYYKLEDLFNDFLNDNLKDIYGTTITKEYKENWKDLQYVVN